MRWVWFAGVIEALLAAGALGYYTHSWQIPIAVLWIAIGISWSYATYPHGC